MLPIGDTIPSRTFPIVNYIIIFINILFFLFEISISNDNMQLLFHFYALIPARYSNPEWATYVGLNANNFWPFLTNIFLHGSWMHLIGNMWTLWIFGDNVEDRMGHLKYLIFYILCGLAASFSHYYLNINSTVPALGASGAISGVMAAYMFLYPKSKIIFFIPLFFLPYFIELSAFFYISVWFIVQLFNGSLGLMFSNNATGIAFWAHIGGFLFGMLSFKFFTYKYKQN